MFWGVFFIGLSAIVFAMVLVGCRNPAKPAWASDAMVQYVWVIAILGLAATGIVLLGFAVGSDSEAISGTETTSSLVAAGLTVAIIWLISPRKRLREYTGLDRAVN